MKNLIVIIVIVLSSIATASAQNGVNTKTIVSASTNDYAEGCQAVGYSVENYTPISIRTFYLETKQIGTFSNFVKSFKAGNVENIVTPNGYKLSGGKFYKGTVIIRVLSAGGSSLKSKAEFKNISLDNA